MVWIRLGYPKLLYLAGSTARSRRISRSPMGPLAKVPQLFRHWTEPPLKEVELINRMYYYGVIVAPSQSGVYVRCD